MRCVLALLAAAAWAAAAPFLSQQQPAVSAAANSVEWPTEFAGRPLYEVGLTAREAGFVRDFPGQVGRFSDGEREIIIRRVRIPSRKLHPAGDCLKGAGFAVVPAPMERDPHGNLWSCVRATRSGGELKVCERIIDDSGQSWSDVSSWYWAALLERTSGPWWAYTVSSGG